MSDLLTTADAARILRFSPATVREMIRRGELRAQRWGRQWRIEADSLSKEPTKPKHVDVKNTKRFMDGVERARARVGIKG